MFYVVILLLLVAFFGFLILYPIITKAPSCSDYKQNGDEKGVDCGGSCARACLENTEDVSVLWARAFRVIPGRYNAVAYIVNHNKSAAIRKINYRFRFGDANNVYIGKREGSTYVPPGGNFAVFEPGIDIGNSIPVYVTFEFTEAPAWLQVPKDKRDQLKILISGIELTDEKTSPRLSAKIKNNSLFTIPDVNIIVILRDRAGNAVAASQTFLSKLGSLSGSNINFTWPEPFAGEVVEKEIIPMYDVFSAKLE